MKVLWTDAAVVQLQSIHDYVKKTSPDYAGWVVNRLTKRSVQLGTFPFSGPIVPEYEINEVRQVIEGSYRIIYLIKEDEEQVEVLAVIHSSREPLKPLE
ncbi:MAG: type II toxin-antitoxin system RelE/ParE family toxin [Pyrinomonadaceae bacterium]